MHRRTVSYFQCFPRSLTSRAEFPLADATMDGFGGADLTISKLRNLCKKQPKDWMVILQAAVPIVEEKMFICMNETCDHAS